ncbi:MAG: hypothetical protein AABZ12_00680 [Planctomycetota bacterium]
MRKTVEQDQRFEWIQKNRTRRDRTKTAGAVVRQVVDELWARSLGPLEEIAEAVAPIVDAEFRDCCSLAGFDQGVLRVTVKEPALVSWMSSRWSGRLMDALRVSRTGRRVRRIIFAAGDGGTALEG